MRNCIFAALLLALPTAEARAQQQRPLMPWQTLQQVTQQHFASLPRREFSGLVVWEDLRPLLDEVDRKGWDLPYRDQIEEAMVKQSEYLARFARSPRGAKYLNAAGGANLLLDRVDRISGVRGGQQTLEDLVRLPSVKRFAKSSVAELPELLPPSKGGKRRKIEGFNKPTGRAYSAEQVIERMQQLHAEAEQERRRNVVNTR